MNQRTENPNTFRDAPVEGLREDALAMVAQCIECGSCYVDCAFGNYPESTDTCKEWIRESNDFILGKRKDVGKGLKDANLKCAECNRVPRNLSRRHLPPPWQHVHEAPDGKSPVARHEHPPLFQLAHQAACH